MSYWAEDMRQTFHVSEATGEDFRGRTEYAAPVAHPCRWTPGARLVREAQTGKQVATEGTLFTTARLTVQSRFWLPGADPQDVGASRLPKAVFEQSDLETGAFDHCEVLV